MPDRSCAIVVLAAGGTRGFPATLDSIACQDTRTPVETVIVLEPGSGFEQDYRELLQQSPWIAHWKIVRPSGADLADDVLRASLAEYFLFMHKGDVLTPNAVSLLIGAIAASGETASLGATRWTNGLEAWSDESVGELFGREGPVKYDWRWPPERFAQAAVAMAHRSRLTDQTPERPGLAALVQEYVCRRHSDENPGDGHVYRLRESGAFSREAILAAAFPRHAPVKAVPSKDLWLFGERRGEAAEENGLALFRYCVENLPHIECYYVLNENIACAELRGYEDRVIHKNTDEWESKIRRASHFFFTDSAEDILRAASDVEFFPDVVYVYLTHGCLAYSPGVYQKAHQYIDYVTCTNRQDIESASKEWGFPVGKFLLTGLARWDLLRDNSAGSREILFCPTWRKRFNSAHWNTGGDIQTDIRDVFLDSEYYHRVRSLLLSPALISMLERADLHITVNMHFRFKKYLEDFKALQSDRIRIATPENDRRNLRQMMQDAVALITDYSSIMWDVGFMGKPVFCYQFDKPEMLAERDKEQFAISDNELFPTVCYSEQGLVQALETYVSGDIHRADVQQDKLSEYIPLKDDGNCARICAAVTALRQPMPNDTAPGDGGAGEALMPSAVLAAALSSLESGLRVGVIAGVGLPPGTEAVALEPDTWKGALETGGFDVLLVAPHLDARSVWAPVFFEPGATLALLAEAVHLCKSANIRSLFCHTPLFVYDDYLRAAADRFDERVAPGRVASDSTRYDVSVIIPAYNSEHYLPATIDSVLGQQFAGAIEVIVVNDGSTDGTGEVVESYAARHANVVALSQPNARQGMARNHALLRARGEYVMFLDADDVLPVNAVAALHQALKYHDTKISAGLVASCDGEGENQRINQAYYHYAKAPGTVTAQTWPHLFYDPSCAGKMYLRKYLLDSRLFFPQSYHEDQVFAFKLFSDSERVAVTASVVYLYVARAEPGAPSGTQTFSNFKFREMLMAGILAGSLVRESGLPQRIVDYALGFLVMRYDRFIWKQNASSGRPKDAAANAETNGLLAKFLAAVPEDVIRRNARHCAVFLLLVKRSLHAMAAGLRLPGSDAALAGLASDGRLPDDLQTMLETTAERFSGYNYYKAVPIGSLRDNRQVVTEMSYGYRLGRIFVDVAKSPVKVFLAPVRMAGLARDMLSGKGRLKEAEEKERMLQNSPRALLNHSDFIKSTASYKLGVAVMEAFTRSPLAVLKLPWKAWRIYKMNA